MILRWSWTTLWSSICCVIIFEFIEATDYWDAWLRKVEKHSQGRYIESILLLWIRVHICFSFSKIFLQFLYYQRLVLEAVASLELMDPGRSTLQDDTVSSHVHLTVEEVIKDLAELKWQECCVTSLQTFNGGNRNSSQVQFQRSKAPAPHNKERGIQKKQKRNSIASYTTDIIHVGPPGNDSGGESRAEQSVSCTSVADAGGICRNSWPQLMQRSKRCP